MENWSQWRENVDEGDLIRGLILVGLSHQEDKNVPFNQESIQKALTRSQSRLDNNEMPILRLRFREIDFADVPLAEDLQRIWIDIFNNIEISLRVEVNDPFDDAETCELLELLSKKHICYWRVDRPRRPITWRWPLRFGASYHTNQDLDLQFIFKESILRDHPWIESISQYEEISTNSPESDVLITTVHEVLHDEASPILQGCADVVLILDDYDRDTDSSEQFKILRSARKLFQSSAIVLQPLKWSDWESQIHSYLVELIRELSHAMPFDESVSQATDFLNNQSQLHICPLILSSKRFLKNSSIRHRLSNFRNLLESQEIISLTDLPPELQQKIDVSTESRPNLLDNLPRILQEMEINIGYFRESDMATTMALVESSTADLIHKSVSPRFLQAQVTDSNSSQAQIPFFESGQSHTIHVLIGPLITGWISPENATLFPENDLPAELDEHELQVHLVELHSNYKSHTKSIILPRQGPSNSCRFQITVPDSLDEVSFRLVITFRNRILQSAILSGDVRQEDSVNVEKTTIYLEIETLNVGSLDSLHERSWFDSSIMLNRTRKENELIGVMNDKHSFTFTPSDSVSQLQEDIEKALDQIALDREQYENLFTKASQKLLKELAYSGFVLRSHLEDLKGGSPFGERIQVTCVEPDRRIPLEFCYDGPVPQENAEVCPHSIQAMQSNGCSKTCPYANDISQVVCPLNFWGLNRIIERHLYDNKSQHDIDNRKQLQQMGNKYGARFIDDRPRSGLFLFDRVLCGLNRRVADYVPDGEYQVENVFSGLIAESPKILHEWEKWSSAIASSPSLLLVIGHVTKEDNSIAIRKIEIGNNSWRRAADLETLIRPDESSNKPMVLLFACEASEDQESILDFVPFARRGGAAIIVTTNCKIHVSHAVDLVKRFIPLLHAGCLNSVTLGEVMRDIRKTMVADGNIMPMCLTAFGDADYTIEIAATAAQGVLGKTPVPV